MSDHAVMIERFHAAYRIPDVHPEPERVRGLLDRVLHHDLAAACEQALVAQLPPEGDALWLIRRLHFDLTVDVSAFNDAQLAQVWGEALARQIAYAITHGDPDVLYFPDWTAYLTQFLIDLAGGSAWDKWYYDAFEGLRALPDNMAAREVLIREPTQGILALRALASQGRLERLLSILSERDARRIFAAFLSEAESLTLTPAAVAAVLTIWRAARLHSAAADALRLVATLPQVIPGAVRAVALLIQFADALRHSPNPRPLIEALARRDLAGGAALVPAEMRIDLPTLVELIDGDLEWAVEIARTVASDGVSESGAQNTSQVLVSAYGGAFLLLLAMSAYGFDRALETYAPEEAALLCCLALGKCLGDAQVLYDPALRLVTHLMETPSEEEWQRVRERSGDLLLRRMIERLTSAGKASGRYLLAERIDFAGEAFILLRDIEYDFWLYAAPPSVDGLLAALDVVQAAADQPIECLLLGEGVDVPPPGILPPALLLSAPEASSLDLIDRFRARSKPPSTDLDYFARVSTAFDPRFDLALTLFARAILRTLAQRLMGFEWSGAAYLYDRFLAGSSSVELGQDALEVRLPDSPLALILRMAGVDGETFTLSWLPEVEIRLRLP
jgi:hypothetical protein